VLAPLSGAAAWVHLGVIVTLVLAFAFYPLASLVGQLRRHLRAIRLGGIQRLLVSPVCSPHSAFRSTCCS
jgi:hypothetical protein